MLSVFHGYMFNPNGIQKFQATITFVLYAQQALS